MEVEPGLPTWLITKAEEACAAKWVTGTNPAVWITVADTVGAVRAPEKVAMPSSPKSRGLSSATAVVNEPTKDSVADR
jgi:hypothetical protein